MLRVYSSCVNQIPELVCVYSTYLTTCRYGGTAEDRTITLWQTGGIVAAARPSELALFQGKKHREGTPGAGLFLLSSHRAPRC